MKNYSTSELNQIFWDNFDCYIDADNAIPGMSIDKFCEIINKLKKEGIRNNE